MADDLAHIDSSGDTDSPVRARVSGRRMDDLTRDEARALYCALGVHLLRTANAPPVRMSTGG